MVVERLKIDLPISNMCDRIYDVSWLEPIIPNTCKIDTYPQRGDNSASGLCVIRFSETDKRSIRRAISSLDMDYVTSYEKSDYDPSSMSAKLSSNGEIILYNGDLVSADRIMPFSKKKILKLLPQCLREFYTTSGAEYNPKDISIQENYMNVMFKVLCKDPSTAEWFINTWYSTFKRRGGDYTHIAHCLSDMIEYLDTRECVVTGILLHKDPDYKRVVPMRSKLIKGVRKIGRI